MKILVIGSGGREHALLWAMSQSDKDSTAADAPALYCHPGSAATSLLTLPSGLEKRASWEELAGFAARQKIDLTVCGPEAPLADGVADLFRQRGLAFLGPGQAAAQLESSKVFAKEFMARHGIPTARFEVFDDFAGAERFLAKPPFGYPLVVKADGLAAGKGVAVCPDRPTAREFLEKVMGQRIFGESGGRVVIEECLQGEELSCIALCDGLDFLCLPPAQDHKRLRDGDLGPNTGGMGAYSWDGIFPGELLREVESRILLPTLSGMAEEGNRYNGFLYAGIMVTAGGPMVLEYNVRLGDPETQPILMRLRGSPVEALARAAGGGLRGARLDWRPDPAVCVVAAAEGYPEQPAKGDRITGLEEAGEFADVQVFHSGTGRGPRGWETAGGRVLGVTARGGSLRLASRQAYQALERIRFRGMHFRRDIAARGLAREA